MEARTVNKGWNRRIAAAILSVSMIASIAPYAATAQEGPATAVVMGKYMLTNSMSTEVKSILNERSSEGTRIGVVVRVYNEGYQVTRVPEFELRVRTKDGLEYTLKPSASNATGIQPKEKAGLSYLMTLDSSIDIALSELVWVEVDEFVYPQKETDVLIVPIGQMEWRGGRAFFAGDEGGHPWGKSFTLPVYSDTIEYTPVQLVRQMSPEGPVAIVVMSAHNLGKVRAVLPPLRLDAYSDSKVFQGNRVEQGSVELEPGEKRYIYTAIPVENETELKGLYALTPETFVGADLKPIEYSIGRLRIQLPIGKGQGPASGIESNYEWGSSISFDPLNKLVPRDVNVSLVELHMHEAEGDGYQTAVAKFHLQNTGDKPVPVPNFQSELIGVGGASYIGSRQKAAAQTLIPNLGYVVSYSFNVPRSENGEKLGLNLLDSLAAAPYHVPIAGVETQVQSGTDSNTMNFYPFQVKLNYWTLQGAISTKGDGPFTYTYKMKLDLDIERQEDIVVDENFSKLKVELVDSLGKTLGYETLPFTGMNRLVSGEQSFVFQDLKLDQQVFPLTVHLYESIDTPFGEAKRLVKTLQQR
jgi:hypothetical protein